VRRTPKVGAQDRLTKILSDTWVGSGSPARRIPHSINHAIPMKVLVLDNYDSFTWNLVHGLEAAGGKCIVHRSDRVSLDEIKALNPDRIVLSPGPFGPDQTGVCPDVVRAFHDRVPILGVCLGMQVIATVAGADVVESGLPVHGKASMIQHDGQGLLRGMPQPFVAGRYHSLIVDPSSIPPGLIISAKSEDGHVMGCRLGGSLVEGLLFHPESFLTEQGFRIFENFMASGEELGESEQSELFVPSSSVLSAANARAAQIS
jgi:anthranilate synthase/aminodeoxychorismate synthase-like glutamine amidotransferase